MSTPQRLILTIAFGAAAELVAVVAVPAPPLPTPCLAGNCGAAAQSFVAYGTAGATVSGTTLNITQSTPKAVLNWANFNIANGYTVNFTQPGSTSAVLNNIWSADPSVIAGKLTANGQVYLYNQNGIVFDKGAQVNVAGLTASTLSFAPVANSQDPNALFEVGILSQNAASPVLVGPATGTPGTITVNSGASLTADGGRILLLGSAVTNNGSISTPDGQAILGAAGKAVYLAASSSPDMRGLLIEVDDTGVTGTVVNNGEISAPRGNITLAGMIVNQQGLLSATTSVTANGSIYLVAGDTAGEGTFYNPNPLDPNHQPTAFGGLLPNEGGTVLLAPGSVTEVLPDSTDTGTLTVAEQARLVPSQVELAGRVVALEGSASIHAPDGVVNTYAAGNPAQMVSSPTSQTGDGGSIYLDAGSSIDVSGLTNVAVPATQNVVPVTLETNDLQNDPLLRNGFLHGTAVEVDINDPPTLFDVTPYANNIKLGIDQLLTKAGTINLDASSALITRAGSTLNVSGGSVAYQGGLGPSTTNLIAANGKVYNISTAPNALQYVGIANSYSYTDPAWGISSQGNGQSYYAGYTQGAAAGTLSVQAPQVYLRGTMQAATTDGLYQRTPAAQAPGGTFVLGCDVCTNSARQLDFGVNGGVSFADTLSDTLVGDVAVDGYVVSSMNVPAVSTLSPNRLIQGGFNTIDIYSSGTVQLPEGLDLTFPVNGTFTVKSTLGISIDGNITAPGGQVVLQTFNPADGLPHDVELGTGSVIDVSGNWTNDSPSVTLQPGTSAPIINGGDVTLSAAGDVVLGIDSRIDVSGGGWVNQSNSLSEGSAGQITLAANYSLNPQSPVANPYTGTVDIGAGATLLGASLRAGAGGTLSLQSGSLTIGSTSAGTPGELLLPADFFTQGGFSQYNLTGQEDVMIGNLLDTTDSAPVNIAPVQETLAFTRNALLQPTGTSVSSFTQLQTLPAAQRSAASISIAAAASDPTGADVGDVTLAQDASITTDPGADVTLATNDYSGSIRVLGSIRAPAGNISLLLDSNPVGSDSGFIANQRIELGPDAVLAAPAYAQIDTLNPQGYSEGSVLPGGTISLQANKGFVLTDPGSVIDVDGTAAILDIPGTYGVRSAAVAGSAGTIDIGAREGIVLQGTLSGHAATLNGVAVNGAAGGTLTLALGTNYNDSGPLGIAATQAAGGAVFYPTATRTLTLSSEPQSQLFGTMTSGTANISVPAIEAGGFDDLAFGSADTIAFSGSVALQAGASLILDAPLFVGNAGARVSLQAPYVAVGNYFNNAFYFDSAFPSPNAAAVLNPVSGTASIDVSAQQIDIRGVSGWSGFASEDFVSSGDIRLVAEQNNIGTPPTTLNVPGNPGFESAFNTSATLDLQAAQSYPTTTTAFAINDLPADNVPLAASAATTVTISSSLPAGSVPATPLSAGGSLSINATNINQYGVLRAPMGQITLSGTSFEDAQGAVIPGSVVLADGSLTSVSADGLIIPYGSTANGSQWTYSPVSGSTNVLTQPPTKQISLQGSVVSVNNGAQLDLSGGGDLYAYEFIAGEGGSVDVLDQASLTSTSRASNTPVYSYAIVPTLSSAFAPLDAQYAQNSSVGPAALSSLFGLSGKNALLGLNPTIYLSGVPGLAAGTYALLPADYALLPGAYAIQVVAPNSGITQGASIPIPGGGYEVAGRFGVAGTNILSSLTSTVLVASDATVRTQSQYTDTYANTFFSAAAATAGTAAPRLPADAGQLLLSATSSLTLNGSVNLNAGSFVSGATSDGTPVVQQGQGGDVAITAQNIAVVDAGTQAPAAAGTLQLDVQQLNNLDAQTLILGASAENTAAGEQLNVGGTQTVELKNTTALTSPEIILAAQDSVTVDPNARIATSGSNTAGSTSAQTPETLLLPGGGALLRVSSGAAEAIAVDPSTLPQNPTGIVSIDAGASVQSSGSLLLYGTNNTTLAPGAQIYSPEVGLYSSLVSLGDAPAGTPGLVLGAALLGSLKGLTDLTIGSSSTINLYGAVQLGTPGSITAGLNSISLDAAGLGGYGAGDKVLQAGNITLMNSGGGAATFVTTPDGSGALQLIASGQGSADSGQLVLGAGSKAISGFSSIDLRADGDIIGQGVGALSVSTSTAVPVNLSAAALIGTAGSTQTLSTGGSVTISGAAANGAASSSTPGVGAQLSIQGSAIAQNGTLELPAGILGLTATSGDITLGSGSLTSAAGTSQSYTVTQAAAAGGQINLTAQAGNVVIASGATVDVSGASGTASGSDAGTLSISAPLGTFASSGRLKGGAPASFAQGNFSLDVGQGLSSQITQLTSVLGESGFTGALNLRTRTDGAVTLDDTVQASGFELTVDQGSIDVASTAVINTSGGTALDPSGGAIALWAGTGLTVAGGAHLLANAGSPGPIGTNGTSLASPGGDITLGTSSGTIAIDGGSAALPTVISMQGGGAAGTDGTLTLRAPRTDTGVQIQIQNAASLDLVTRQPLIAEGVLTYTATELGSADPSASCATCYDMADLNGVLFTQARSFLANTTSIIANDLGGLSNVEVRPGIEIDSPGGDLTLGSATARVWDLASWDAALGVPVDLTLRASGNLIFAGSLSDGFAANSSLLGAAAWKFGEPGGLTDSGSYILTAGADLTSANPLAVVAQPAPAFDLTLAANTGNPPPNSGNLILTPNNLIRTGTGSIQIAAGGDVLLGYAVGDANGNVYDNGTLQVTESDPLTSAIYTAGTPSALTPAQASQFTAPTLTRALATSGVQISYPTDGGDISVTAADDIRSAASQQYISDWLWRSSSSGGANIGTSTTWWIMFNDFQQGIGALGGGDLSVSAGRDIVNLGAVIPTTGRLLGASGSSTLSDLVLTGGGSLRVQAGADIVGGLFEDDWGDAQIRAGHALTSSADSTFGQQTNLIDLGSLIGAIPPASGTEIYPILAVGNGIFDVSGRTGVALDGVTNSTTLPLTINNVSMVQSLGSQPGAFYPYAAVDNPSTLNIVSAGGNVVLNSDSLDSSGSNLPIVFLSTAGAVYAAAGDPNNYLSVYPSTLNVAALSGDIDLGNAALSKASANSVDLILFPAATGNLNLLAAGAINNDGIPYTITQSEVDPTLVPNVLTPMSVVDFTGLAGVPLPQQPLHQADAQPIALVANRGDIGTGSLNFPKAADVIAGGDITDLTFSGKSLNPSDVTLIAAGGNIDYSTPTLPITNTLQRNTAGIDLAGPGYLEVLAGGSIDLGDANGILTTGSLTDSRLSTTGASLIVGAGLGINANGGLRQPAEQAFTNAYLAPSASTGEPGPYATNLVSYMQQLYPSSAPSSYSAALTSFLALTPEQQLPLLTQVLTDELSATGLAHTTQGTSYARGYTAINTLFPTTDSNGKPLAYNGDLSLFYSQLKTEQGGDVDLLVPGGSVIVGVANPPASLSTVKGFTTATGLTVPAEVNLGILVLGEGAVQGFADQDFTVNSSRILTLEGGDIILWASNGGIDAGKGAKSASGAPPPVIQTDASGNLFVNPSNSVSGSGIGQLLTTPGVKPGLVNLIAPKGTVNAGDAGIRVAGNLNIAAVQVIGASNITVAGTATGVPVSQAGTFAGALSGANSLGDASKSAVDQVTQDLNSATNYQQLSDSLAPLFINVKLFCLGVECETD
jgi:filamentous hemagglutinin family protein